MTIFRKEVTSSITAFIIGISSITALVGTAFAIDDTYVRSSDMQAVKASFRKEISNAQRVNLEDKIFELQIRSNSSDIDSDVSNALLFRYQQRLNNMSKDKQ